MPWSTIGHISSGFSLVAFMVTVAGLAFRAYLSSINAHVPASIRVRLAEIGANRFGVPARSLTKSQQNALAIRELNYRLYRLLISAFLVVVITAAVTYIAHYVIPPPIDPTSDDWNIHHSDSADCVAYRATQAQGSDDGKSLIALGGFYERGQCVHQNKKTALSYYLSAAYHEEPYGYLLAGALFATGIDGAAPDYAKAKEYYQDGISHGDPGGYVLIGELYELGEGVGKDAAEALSLYKKAADLGSLRGLTLLGAAYLDGGRGTARNCQLGMKYELKAYQQHEPRAATLIGAQYCAGPCAKVDPLTARKYLHEGEDWGDKPRATILLASKECQVP